MKNNLNTKVREIDKLVWIENRKKFLFNKNFFYIIFENFFRKKKFFFLNTKNCDYFLKFIFKEKFIYKNIIKGFDSFIYKYSFKNKFLEDLNFIVNDKKIKLNLYQNIYYVKNNKYFNLLKIKKNFFLFENYNLLFFLMKMFLLHIKEIMFLLKNLLK